MFFATLIRVLIISGKVGHGGLASGSNQEHIHSAMRMASVQDAFTHQSSSLPNNTLRMMSAVKQFGFCESSNSMDEMKFASQGVQNFQPHSLPEHHDGLAHGIPCNLGLGVTEGYASHLHGVNINRRPGDLKGGRFHLLSSLYGFVG